MQQAWMRHPSAPSLQARQQGRSRLHTRTPAVPPVLHVQQPIPSTASSSSCQALAPTPWRSRGGAACHAAASGKQAAPSSSSSSSDEDGADALPSTSTSAAAAPTGTEASEQPGASIYTRPELYEKAFSYRDIKQEVKFLRDVFKKHGPGATTLSRVLDLGCGPGAHALGLASAGVSQVVGVELNPAMLTYALSKAQQQQQALSSKAAAAGGKGGAGSGNSKPQKGTVLFVPGDIREVQAALRNAAAGAGAGASSSSNGSGGAVVDTEAPYDMVTCLLGTLTHMTTNEDALRVFRGVAAALRPGGLFVVELAHPGDLFDGTLIIGDGGKEMWEVPQGKDGKLLVEWGAEFDNFDPVTQVIDRTVIINRFEGEQVVQTVEEVVPARSFTVQEVELLAYIAGLSVKSLYGDMSTSIGLSHEEAYRMVVVLQKPSSS